MVHKEAIFLPKNYMNYTYEYTYTYIYIYLNYINK